jgi:hypothetical protein
VKIRLRVILQASPDGYIGAMITVTLDDRFDAIDKVDADGS